MIQRKRCCCWLYPAIIMMTDLRKIIWEEPRPYLSNQDRIRSWLYPTERYEEDRHHAYVKSRWGTSEAMVPLFIPVHRANHRLFWVANITKKFLILALMDQPTLNEEFVEELADNVNRRDDKYVYKNGIYLPK